MKHVIFKEHLITPELKARFKELGRQETADPIVVAKFFNPCGAATWYITQYSEEDNMGYGYVTGLQVDEWGYVSFTELEALRCRPLELPVERDLYFDEVRFSELRLR